MVAFTPLESPSLPACRQTGRLGRVEIESISTPYWGRVQSPELSNGINPLNR